ncbi:serine/threonine-protein kinase, partial [Actinocorallia lasiicapitis]
MANYAGDDLVGESIGPFRIERLLGQGGMGRVYLGVSVSGRRVAVKVVRPELADDPGFRKRFRAEVEAAMAVSGAFTAPVVDADPDGPLPWLATVHVDGPSLQDEVDARGPLPAGAVRRLGASLAESLTAIHRAGLIHRDLKPANILLASDGPRVIDFGISRAADGTAYTATGGVVGSAGYMSPEQILGRDLTPASDVFALGAVLVFAATGRPAFGTGPFQAVLFRAAYEPPALDGLHDPLASTIAACLAKNPLHRPPLSDLPHLFISSTATPADDGPATALPVALHPAAAEPA